ncbi:MAG TPA: glycosyltransferase family 9 protein [Hanamia sp.]|nr:glycosyltransferase family 9 protein [Hanamia sp.]
MIEELANIKKIAVFRALQLGDMLCVIPAIRALRHEYPNAKITLLGLPWAKNFVERFNSYFDKFIHFPGYPGLPEQHFNEEAFDEFLKIMRKEKFDLLFQMQGNGTIVNPLMFTFGAKYVAGFYNDKSFVDSPFFMLYPDHGAEIRRHLLLMEHLQIPAQGDHLEFPLTKKDQKDFDELLLPVYPKNYIIIHPGSRGRHRQWPPKFFALIADYCIEQGFTIVITGTKEESDITGELIKCMHHVPIDLTGKTSLGAIAILIKDAFAIICNCTGVSHVADAFDTPSVVISMDGEPKRWAPLNRKLHHVIDWTKHPHFEKVLLETDTLIKNLLAPKD